MRNQPQLITYVDRLSGATLRELSDLLESQLNGVFGGVHLLPFFNPIDGADAGFDPIDHTEVDRRLGTWDDVRVLASQMDVMADLIVNHISSRSRQFRDYDARGEESPYAGMFLTYSRVFPHGATESDLLALHSLRPGLPFTQYDAAHGNRVLLWTTFTSEQIDIDVHHPEGRRYLDAVLTRLHGARIRAIRVDAAGHAVKKAGTSSFMIPETFAFLSDLTARAHALGIEVLVELHAHHREQMQMAGQVDWVYDFALPPLVLHTMYTRDATALSHWIAIRPRNAIAVLDTHDGIGVLDAAGDRHGHDGLLSPLEIESLVNTIHERTGGESREASGGTASNLDAHQINCTFYDALGARDDEYLAARALQCFVPGIPQIYYVGLLAGRNDLTLFRRTGVGRDINRHYYAPGEVEGHLGRPVVQKLIALLKLRRSHPAFGGAFEMKGSGRDDILMEWTHGTEWAKLDVNLAQMTTSIICSRPGAGSESVPLWP